MLKGFKDFIMRGNVIDLAVAVVIGGAFTAIVTAFTNHLINPLIAVLGGSEVKGLGFQLISGNDATFMDFGAVITAAINFLLVAAVVYFVLVAPMNKFKERQAARKGVVEDEEEKASIEAELLEEIRDLLKSRNI
ncbi:large conductance mechanosensitive channel protein MscL [Corynebacterium epidermidicanis]|uniref:Large-conductance mechanosensitive channel n=1 Tax=Corynebacterium epidermidicanis TaxID=1050174 RepID=A0A0G3GNH4_9CORY|nr:large conductance mechanosensitive channel protein MscL [Corynebacterium epidermidicanis]AKK02679.1 large conductance mechanosensitive channel protein [Corynebacterium epidermidicanis]